MHDSILLPFFALCLDVMLPDENEVFGFSQSSIKNRRAGAQSDCISAFEHSLIFHTIFLADIGHLPIGQGLSECTKRSGPTLSGPSIVIVANVTLLPRRVTCRPDPLP